MNSESETNVTWHNLGIPEDVSITADAPMHVEGEADDGSEEMSPSETAIADAFEAWLKENGRTNCEESLELFRCWVSELSFDD